MKLLQFPEENSSVITGNPTNPWRDNKVITPRSDWRLKLHSEFQRQQPSKKDLIVELYMPFGKYFPWGDSSREDSFQEVFNAMLRKPKRNIISSNIMGYKELIDNETYNQRRKDELTFQEARLSAINSRKRIDEEWRKSKEEKYTFFADFEEEMEELF